MPEISHPIPPLSVDARTAGAQVQRWYKESNGRRRIPTTSRYIAEAATQHGVTIFNIGPWNHTQPMGSLGTFFIPAYDPAKDEQSLGYAAIQLPGVVVEFYPEDNTSMRQLMDDGDYVAEQIVGFGAMHDPRNSLLQYGVGIEREKPPTAASLAAARERLTEYAQRLFGEAELAAAEGPRVLQAMRTERHTWAARHIGRADVSWMVQTNTAARQRCEVCGTYSEPGVMMCPNHPNLPYIFDQDRYDAFVKRSKKRAE